MLVHLTVDPGSGMYVLRLWLLHCNMLDSLWDNCRTHTHVHMVVFPRGISKCSLWTNPISSLATSSCMFCLHGRVRGCYIGVRVCVCVYVQLQPH